MNGPVLGADEIKASVKLILTADSGYTAQHECRISAMQWGAILAAAEGKVVPATDDASPELLDACAAWVRHMDGNEASTQEHEDKLLDAMRNAIAKAIGEPQ